MLAYINIIGLGLVLRICETSQNVGIGQLYETFSLNISQYLYLKHNIQLDESLLSVLNLIVLTL